MAGRDSSEALSRIPSIEANRPCVVCGGSDSELKQVFRFAPLPRPFELRECRECGLLFNSPRLADLAPLYAEGYYVFHETERARYARAFRQVKRHLDPALGGAGGSLEILEVGAANGHLLHVLRRLGHDANGVELSAAAIERARSHFQLDVFQGALEDYVSGAAARRHDVVWCNDVLEHVPDPLQFVRSCARALKPGGRLILDTPNAGTAAVGEGRANWNGYNPYHIFLFGPENLARLLERAGLRPAATFSYDNDRAAGLTPRRPLRKFFKIILATVGLWGWIDERRRRRSRTWDGELLDRPMRGEEIDRRLRELPWFSETPDAKAALAENHRGNNLVVHALEA